MTPLAWFGFGWLAGFLVGVGTGAIVLFRRLERGPS